MIEAPGLKSVTAVRHGFFTRKGGESAGIYASLNTGLGSGDERSAILANRKQVQDALGADSLVTPYQHHSPDVVVVDAPWADGAAPKADALVTQTPGIAIAVNTADCTPVLFADRAGKVIGAAHAGWKGALAGVLEETVGAMVQLGAEPGSISAAIGPAISKSSYEVGPEFHDRFIEAGLSNAQFFVPTMRGDHFMFDLPGFARARLASLSLLSIEDLQMCTYANESNFFSYRRTTHRSEPDYGRQMSAIVINT